MPNRLQGIRYGGLHVYMQEQKRHHCLRLFIDIHCWINPLAGMHVHAFDWMKTRGKKEVRLPYETLTRDVNSELWK